MKKAKTLQIGKRLLIFNGQDPLRYIDLSTNKVHEFKIKKPFKFIYKIRSNK